MQAVCLTPKRAELEIFKQMKDSARSARDDGSYRTISEAMDGIAWSGVHPMKLSDLASARELDNAIAELTEQGVWYPETL